MGAGHQTPALICPWVGAAGSGGGLAARTAAASGAS